MMKSIVLALTLSLGAMSLAGPAQADRLHGRYGGWNGHWNGCGYRCGWHNGHGDAVAAGFLGFAAGTIFGGAVARPYYYGPGPYYYGPGPYYPAAAPGYAPGGPDQTQAWLIHCQRKYKSFDAQSGTYLGYDGERHVCQ